MHFERQILPFKMHKIIFFSSKPEKILGFTSKFRQKRVFLNTGIFHLAKSGDSEEILQNVVCTCI